MVSPDRNDLLDDIERRQNEILRDLDELNLRVERALGEHLGTQTPADGRAAA